MSKETKEMIYDLEAYGGKSSTSSPSSSSSSSTSQGNNSSAAMEAQAREAQKKQQEEAKKAAEKAAERAEKERKAAEKAAADKKAKEEADRKAEETRRANEKRQKEEQEKAMSNGKSENDKNAVKPVATYVENTSSNNILEGAGPGVKITQVYDGGSKIVTTIEAKTPTVDSVKNDIIDNATPIYPAYEYNSCVEKAGLKVGPTTTGQIKDYNNQTSANFFEVTAGPVTTTMIESPKPMYPDNIKTNLPNIPGIQQPK